MGCNLKFSVKEPQLRIFALHKDNFTPPLSLCYIMFCRQVPLNNTKVLLANTLPFPNMRGFHHLPSVFHQLAPILRAVPPKPAGSSLRSSSLSCRGSTGVTWMSFPLGPTSLPQWVKNSPCSSVNLSRYLLLLSSLLRYVWQDYKEQWDLKPDSWFIGWWVERTPHFWN